MRELNHMIGKQVIECREELHRFCKKHGYSLNIQDPEFNPYSIMKDANTLNVKTDKNSIVKGFTLG